MTNRHWRELLEIVGVVSIVAALLIVAVQLRNSNEIAARQTAVQLAMAYDTVPLARATDPEFAKLFPKLAAPEAHLTTATESSQIRGIAEHYFNLQGAVQGAYDDGLISRATLELYTARLEHTLEAWPGIRSHYIELYDNLGSTKSAAAYAPVAAYLEKISAQDEP